jgi:branched-chain amino acid transport system substrate-binding protein
MSRTIARILLVVLGCALVTAPLAGPLGAAEMAPLTVGFVGPLSGVFAPTGQDLLNGFNLYFERSGNKLGGRPIKFITEDDQFNPGVALTKTRKLLESDRVELLTGIINSAAAYAMREYIDQQGLPTVISVAGGDNLTQRTRGQFIVRTGWGSSSHFAHPFGVYAARSLGYRRVAVIADDFAFGHEWVGGFQRTFEENGGRVVAKIWSPLGSADFSPYLTRVPQDVEAVVGAVVGAIALRFVKQYADFGMKARFPLIGPGHMTDEVNLVSMGDEAVGTVTTLHYSAALDNQWNRAFVQRYQAKFNKVPNSYAEAGYTSALWMDRALQRTGGRITDKAAFIKAMQALVVSDTPRGPLRLDQYGNIIQNIYIRRVDRVGGRLQNTVINTFPNVSQFWTYSAEEFLRNPVYGRDYPPCQFCTR